jgi:hypothetical protein
MLLNPGGPNSLSTLWNTNANRVASRHAMTETAQMKLNTRRGDRSEQVVKYVTTDRRTETIV